MQRGMIIHCQTKYEAKRLMEYLETKGFLWDDGDSPTESLHFKKYGEDTCYNLGLNLKTGTLKDILSFNDIDYYKRKNVDIIEFTDLDIAKEKITNYRDLYNSQEEMDSLILNTFK